MLEKLQGKGTFVKSPKLIGTLGRLTGFAEEVMEKGYSPNSKLLRAQYHNDLYNEKEKLKLREDSTVVVIERIRFADKEPIAIERTCWPKEIGELLLGHDLNGAKYYEILENHGVYLKKANEMIGAVNATIYEADLLGITGGQALLEMTRLSFGSDETPIEYTRTRYRADRYQYNIDLHR